MSEVEEKLTIDEEIFIEAFLHNGFNASQAYRAISPDVTDSTAASQGSRFAKKLKETQYFRNKLQEIRNNYGVTVKKQIERLNAVYERSMEHKVKLEFDPVAKEMVQKIDEDGNMVFEYDSRGAVAAIQEQNKILGHHKEVRFKFDVKGQGPNGEIEHSVKQVKLD